MVIFLLILLGWLLIGFLTIILLDLIDKKENRTLLKSPFLVKDIGKILFLSLFGPILLPLVLIINGFIFIEKNKEKKLW